MTTSPPNSESGVVAKKKRSPVERTLVWGGIGLLLLLVAVEATSRRFYDATLEGLEKAIDSTKLRERDPGIAKSEIDKHIQGFPFRSEVKSVETHKPLGKHEGWESNSQRVVYRWPSLFKSYQLAVVVTEEDRAVLVESNYSKLSAD